MKSSALELVLPHWPYGLEVLPSGQGLLLRPRRKARAHWAKAFRRPRPVADDLAATRQIANAFDAKDWQW